MPASDRSVLIVDDDEDIRANIEDILDDLGYRTATAADGNAALELLQSQTYDVALLDYKMPGMDGATLYSEMRRICPELVAIMISAYCGSDGADRATEAGVWSVLRKPVDFSVLLPMINEAMDAPVVLIADDDEEFCANLWEILREHGYRVCLAHSEVDAISCSDSPQFQIAVVDMCLGDGDGRKVFRRLHEQHPKVRTLLITGFRNEFADDVDQLTRQGLDGVCFKPINIPELLKRLEALRPAAH